MNEKNIILTARIMSMVFSPLYLPMVGLVALFIFSYLSLLPTGYKLSILGLVYSFTVLLPTLLIRMYRRYQGWTPWQLSQKERRMVPYLISILCYFVCYYVMNILLHTPHFMGSILMGALIIQVLCAIINIWWKISVHSAAIGGVTGALLAFAVIFSFNPIWWLCFVLVLAGIVGTSRMVLRQHSLSQIVGGYCLGFILGGYIILIV